MTPYRIALLGLGTVGREVARLLIGRSADLAERAGGRTLELVGVSVRDPGRLAGLPLPPGTIVVADPASLVDNDQIDAVVEVLGGVDPAASLVTTALEKGKAVVTANKALLARHGAELERRSREREAPLRFEASVMGPTPVLSVLAEDLVAMEVDRIRGVVNGTTNWILDAIEHEGMTADEALAKARSFGYTEADPTLDTEGHDAAQKLVVLARLAFGRWIPEAGVELTADEPPGKGGPGITRVTAEEVHAASDRAERIRLVATLTHRDDDTIEARVVPRALAFDDPLAQARGITNVIEIEGPPQGRVVIIGPGAGGPATAGGIVGDLIRLARGAGSTWAGLPPAEAEG